MRPELVKSEASVELLAEDEQQLLRQLLSMEEHPRDLFVLPPGASRHFTQGVVLRYFVLYDDGNGHWGFVGARQGRHTHATLAEAKTKLDSLLKHNPADKLALYGGGKSMYVGFQACYAGHYDPAPIDLGSSPVWTAPRAFEDMRILWKLAYAIRKARNECEWGGFGGTD